MKLSIPSVLVSLALAATSSAAVVPLIKSHLPVRMSTVASPASTPTTTDSSRSLLISNIDTKPLLDFIAPRPTAADSNRSLLINSIDRKPLFDYMQKIVGQAIQEKIKNGNLNAAKGSPPKLSDLATAAASRVHADEDKDFEEFFEAFVKMVRDTLKEEKKDQSS